MKYPRDWMNNNEQWFRSQDFEYRDFYAEMINLEIFEENTPNFEEQNKEFSLSREFWNDCLKRHKNI